MRRPEERRRRRLLPWPSLLPVLLLVILLPAAPASGQAPAPSPAPAWLGDLFRALAAVPERNTPFREEKQLGALKVPLFSSGHLAYRRPAHLEKITTSPEPESLVVDGGRLTLTAGNDAPRSFALDRRPEIAALVDAVRGTLAGDLGLLERQYRVQADGSLSAWRLVLQPIDDRVRQLLRAVVVEGQGTAIRSLRTELANGDVQLLTLSGS